MRLWVLCSEMKESWWESSAWRSWGNQRRWEACLTCCRCWRGPRSAGIAHSSCSLYWITTKTDTKQERFRVSSFKKPLCSTNQSENKVCCVMFCFLLPGIPTSPFSFFVFNGKPVCKSACPNNWHRCFMRLQNGHREPRSLFHSCLFLFLVEFFQSSFGYSSPGGHEGGHVQLQWEGDISCDLSP